MKKYVLSTIFIILILGVGFSGCIDEEENNDPGSADEQVINDIATWIKNL